MPLPPKRRDKDPTPETKNDCPLKKKKPFTGIPRKKSDLILVKRIIIAETFRSKASFLVLVVIVGQPFTGSGSLYPIVDSQKTTILL